MGGERVDPPPVYAVWWTEVAECTGEDDDFDAVSFYEKPGEYLEDTGEWYVFGRANWLLNKMLVASGRRLHEPTVKHEFGHLQADTHAHPDPPFGTCVAAPGTG